MNKKMMKRARLFIALVLVFFILLVGRLAYLQIINHEEYWHRAERNRLRIMPTTAPRGEIFDREGKKLVTNRPGFTVSLMDLGSGYSEETIKGLAEILEMNEEEIQSKIGSQYFRRYFPIRLKTDVDMDKVARIEERRIELPGVMIEVQPIRNYVLDNFASHLLGYMGEGPIREEARELWKEKGYEPSSGDIVGLRGVEERWEHELRGSDGGVQVEVNHTGQAIREFERVEPEPGNNLYLTIDASLQVEMEEALQRAVDHLIEEEGNSYAGEAAAVALDPNNGQILGMASIPSFNPNTFFDDYEDLIHDDRNPLINKAIAEHYPIGSAYKMTTAMSGLETGDIAVGSTINCAGTITRHGATKSCYRGTVHGTISLVNAIKRSCNIYFYETALRSGIDNLSRYSRKFGFGSPTGLNDLFGERGGVVASREYKKELYNEQWYPAETMDAGIGQSFQSITPLQMANYTAMLANRGLHYKPYLVERVVDNDGSTVQVQEPEVLNVLEAQDSHWDAIQRGMLEVTQPGGTAGSLVDFPIAMAGKTGTAQVVGRDGSIPPHSVFVVYAPFDEPEIALAVIVKHGGTGGRTAMPVAREILTAYFGIEEELELEEEIQE